MHDLRDYETTDLVRSILKGTYSYMNEGYFWKNAEENLLISVIDYLKTAVQSCFRVDFYTVLWMLSRPLEELDSLFEGSEKILCCEKHGEKIFYTEKTTLREQERYYADKRNQICLQEYAYYKESEISRATMDIRLTIANYCINNFKDKYYPWIADVSGIPTEILLKRIFPESNKGIRNEFFLNSEKNLLAAIIGYVRDIVGKPYMNFSSIVWMAENSIDGFFSGEYIIDLTKSGKLLRIKTTKREQKEYLKRIRESAYFKFYVLFKKVEMQILDQILKLASNNLSLFAEGGMVHA